MRILMVGAGATGGYYGGRMTQAGRDVTFLVRGARVAQMQARGLQIVSPQGDATVFPKLITADSLAGEAPFDVVIVSTKAYSLDAAMDDFAPAVGPETVVLPLLNGMRHIDTLCARFGRERVMGGSVRIVADVDGEGRIHQLTDLDEFIFGELGGGRSERAERMLQVFRVPGYTVKLSSDMVAALWRKWWILATMGAVCVVSGGTVGEMAAVPHGKAIGLAILHEAIAVAAANGYPADPAFVAQQEQRMTEDGSSLTSSMYRDMLKGAPVEADHILGDLLARAKGVAVPLLTGAYVRLKVYEAKRNR
ncbi:MAG: ketopantoate reductase family protein [Janthinobacterium lividum]